VKQQQQQQQQKKIEDLRPAIVLEIIASVIVLIYNDVSI